MLRPLNDTLIIEPDPYEIVDDNPEVVSAVESGLIQLPDKNSLKKRSCYATVVSAGEGCEYKFRPGKRLLISRWFDQKANSYLTWEGQRMRFTKEHYVNAVVE